MTNNLLQLIGARIKSLRIERSLTQEQLAHLCNTDPSYIRKVEAGHVNISVNRLHTITAVLQISLAEFFTNLDQFKS